MAMPEPQAYPQTPGEAELARRSFLNGLARFIAALLCT